MTPARTLSLQAPAKINLLLRILGKRSDGFHDLDTLFQAVELHDQVTVAAVDEGVALQVEGADVGPTEENLAYRAARGLLDASGADLGLAIRLVKRIPAGAGLGGGSSDAAAVLRAGNALLPTPLPDPTLHELAADLGSDVPFFLSGSALARGTGRGEVLEALPSLPPAALVLVMPPVHVSTAEAYRLLAERRSAGGEPPCSGYVGGAPANWAEVADEAANDFEAVVPGRWPEVATSLEALRQAGARPALLSGSGGACFGVFDDGATARTAAGALQRSLGWTAVATATRTAPSALVGGDFHPGG